MEIIRWDKIIFNLVYSIILSTYFDHRNFNILEHINRNLEQAVLVDLLLPELLNYEAVVRLLFKEDLNHDFWWWYWRWWWYQASWKRLEKQRKETVQCTDCSWYRFHYFISSSLLLSLLSKHRVLLIQCSSVIINIINTGYHWSASKFIAIHWKSPSRWRTLCQSSPAVVSSLR